jgi:dGTPase
MVNMLFDRGQLEQAELKVLAPYALASANSLGRAHREDESDFRTAFQRDRDRIIHSAAFRRLEYKTQVFVFDEGDYYRTRLTHTLEVAQIGRTIARALCANEDLVEAICLAHDLGHPPFGHAGEQVLDALVKDDGGFNHNFQSYRVVTLLEERYRHWAGLNLTRETLSGLAKHETSINVSEVIGIDSGLRGSIEAQISDLTDELAYTAHDLDDGLLAGLIEPDELMGLAIWRLVCSNLGWKGGRLEEVERHALIRELVGVMVEDVLQETEAHLAQVQPGSSQEVQKHPHNLVAYSATMNEMRLEVRQFLYARMYNHYRVVRMHERAQRFIQGMFVTLQQNPSQLSPEWQARIESRGLARTIADYIASMTDRSALQEYRRLFDPLMRP